MTKLNNFPLLDVDGNKIHTHGGSILKVKDTYFWYGENKDSITARKNCPYWHHGVRVYSSKDLNAWKFEGYAIEDSEDINNPFHPKNIMDRPHILFNEKNQEFVMWTKSCIGDDFGKCGFAICKGKSITNMTYIKYINPEPHHAGDFDLFTWKDKAYIVFENPHSEMILRELSDDYMDLGEKWSAHIQKPYPPYVREAPCFFERNGRLMLLTSGTTGYFPNPTIAYDITDLHGEWKEINYPCVNDVYKSSFKLQFSSVFFDKVNNKYIALGDRWLYDYDDTKYDAEDVFKYVFSGGKEGHKVTNKDIEKMSEEDTSKATYVWLEIKFDENNNPWIYSVE